MNFFIHYAVTPGSVGDWEGDEELAAQQVNRIYQALDRSLADSANPVIVNNIFRRVWRDWAQDLRLLDLDESDIEAYTRALLATAA